jgi:hypothetical protein
MIRYHREIEEIEHWLTKDMGGRKRLFPVMSGEVIRTIEISKDGKGLWRLSQLAFYFANEASLASHLGEEGAATWWTNYAEYSYWDDRIDETGYYKAFNDYYKLAAEARRRSPVSKEPRCLTTRWYPNVLWWITYDMDSKARRVLQGLLETPTTGAFGAWESFPFFGLLIKLARMIVENEPANVNLPLEEPLTLGPYEAIFRTWDDMDGLRVALEAALDYHESRSHDDGRYDIGEFSQCPAVLLPLEYMAIRAVRERAGLETPEPDHWLVQTPLFRNLPTVLPSIQDELLEEVLAAVRRDLPLDAEDLLQHYESPLALHRKYEALDPPPPIPPVFSIEELSERVGLFSKKYELKVTLRFTEGETLDKHWPRLVKAVEEWRKKRGKRVDMLNVIFQADGESHPELYRAFADRVETDAALDAWIGELSDYTLSFEELDGTGGRDLIRERQPDGQYLFSEMKYTEMR